MNPATGKPQPIGLGWLDDNMGMHGCADACLRSWKTHVTSLFGLLILTLTLTSLTLPHPHPDPGRPSEEDRNYIADTGATPEDMKEQVRETARIRVRVKTSIPHIRACRSNQSPPSPLVSNNPLP